MSTDIQASTVKSATMGDAAKILTTSFDLIETVNAPVGNLAARISR